MPWMIGPLNPNPPLILATGTTLTGSQLRMAPGFQITGAGITIVLPTPTYGLANVLWKVDNENASASTLSCTGYFIGGGNTASVLGKSSNLLGLFRQSDGTYKWELLMPALASSALSANSIAALAASTSSPSAGNAFATMADVGSELPTAWTPALVWATATPTVTTVARACTIGPKLNFFEVGITSADGKGGSLTSIAPPVAPNAGIVLKKYCESRCTIGAGAPASMGAYVLHSATPANNLSLFDSSPTLTSASAFSIYCSGIYENA